jgi:hypothetical protein
VFWCVVWCVQTASQVKELNEKYDLVGKAKSAVTIAADFSSVAIDKAVELNEKYQIVDKTGEALKQAAARIKESIDKAQES